jgi:hypothetical protein
MSFIRGRTIKDLFTERGRTVTVNRSLIVLPLMNNISERGRTVTVNRSLIVLPLMNDLDL